MHCHLQFRRVEFPSDKREEEEYWPSVLSLAWVTFYVWKGPTHTSNVLPCTCFQSGCFWNITRLSFSLLCHTVCGDTTLVCDGHDGSVKHCMLVYFWSIWTSHGSMNIYVKLKYVCKWVFLLLIFLQMTMIFEMKLFRIHRIIIVWFCSGQKGEVGYPLKLYVTFVTWHTVSYAYLKERKALYMIQ